MADDKESEKSTLSPITLEPKKYMRARDAASRLLERSGEKIDGKMWNAANDGQRDFLISGNHTTQFKEGYILGAENIAFDIKHYCRDGSAAGESLPTPELLREIPQFKSDLQDVSDSTVEDIIHAHTSDDVRGHAEAIVDELVFNHVPQVKDYVEEKEIEQHSGPQDNREKSNIPRTYALIEAASLIRTSTRTLQRAIEEIREYEKLPAAKKKSLPEPRFYSALKPFGGKWPPIKFKGNTRVRGDGYILLADPIDANLDALRVGIKNKSV